MEKDPQESFLKALKIKKMIKIICVQSTKYIFQSWPFFRGGGTYIYCACDLMVHVDVDNDLSNL